MLLNRALTESDDGGETWKSNATLVLGATGPTCEGSIARTPSGVLLLSVPHNWRWRYPDDRRNMTLFKLSKNASTGAFEVLCRTCGQMYTSACMQVTCNVLTA